MVVVHKHEIGRYNGLDLLFAMEDLELALNKEMGCHINQVMVETILKTTKIPRDMINVDGNSAVITPLFSWEMDNTY